MKPTPRQQQILDMRAAGLTARQIGEKLDITRQSVLDHICQANMRAHKPEGRIKTQAMQNAEKNRAALLDVLQVRALTYSGVMKEFITLSPKQIERAYESLSKAGLIRSYRFGGVRLWAASYEVAERTFEQIDRVKAKSQQMADAAAARQRMAEDAAAQKRAQVRRALQEKASQTKTKPVVTLRPAMAGVTIKTANGGEAIVPDGLKVQVIKPPPGRFDVTLPKGAGVISQDWKARRLAEVQQ